MHGKTNLERKGFLLLGVFLIILRKGTYLPVEHWVGGAALNSDRAAAKHQGTGIPTWDGVYAACPTLSFHQQQTGRLFPNTAQSHEQRQNLLPYVVKKSSSISCFSPQGIFIWGVRVSGFWYLHFSFSRTSHRCGLNENMFGFRRDVAWAERILALSSQK